MMRADRSKPVAEDKLSLSPGFQANSRHLCPFSVQEGSMNVVAQSQEPNIAYEHRDSGLLGKLEPRY